MFTKLPFIYFWRDSRQNKGNTEKKRDRLFSKASFFQRKQGSNFDDFYETQDKNLF